MIPSPLLVLALVSGSPGTESISPSELPAPHAAPSGSRFPGSEATVNRLAREAEIAAQKGDATGISRLYRLWNWNRLLERREALVRALETIAVAPRVEPLTRAHAKYLLAMERAKDGRTDEADRLIDEVGLIRRAFIAGPFDNASGRGFSERLAP